MGKTAALQVIYTNIGRGHPYYLDGIVEAMRDNYADRLELMSTDVFALSGGWGRRLWRLARYMYHTGSQGGMTGRFYERIRRERKADRPGRAERIMARDLRGFVKEQSGPVLVAHPLLASMLSDLAPVYYQHGEVAVPREAAVAGCAKVYVPLETSADALVQFGLERSGLEVSGLCVESRLVPAAGRAYGNRLERLRRNRFLTGAFFSSGAEPSGHVAKIIMAAESLIPTEHKGVIFCRAGGRLEYALRERGLAGDDPQKTGLEVLAFRSRREENELTLSVFDRFDYFLGPAHERTNWAIGLGLPMFVLHPTIGTFSPLNHSFLINRRVAVDIASEKDAAGFVSKLDRLLDSGALADMARNGFNQYRIDGFSRIADSLVRDMG